MINKSNPTVQEEVVVNGKKFTIGFVSGKNDQLNNNLSVIEVVCAYLQVVFQDITVETIASVKNILSTLPVSYNISRGKDTSDYYLYMDFSSVIEGKILGDNSGLVIPFVFKKVCFVIKNNTINFSSETSKSLFVYYIGFINKGLTGDNTFTMNNLSLQVKVNVSVDHAVTNTSWQETMDVLPF